MKKIENNSKTISYKNIISISNLKNGLSRTKSDAAPGLDGEVKKTISDLRLVKLHKELATQVYKPKPSKRVGIPKPGGGIRYLGISSQIDKVVQGALLNMFEPVSENIFLEVSYGFRPGKGCHDALKKIKYGWKGVRWVVSIDIEKCFDKINHDILLEKLGKYCDQPTIELIRKLLKAGYVDIHNLTDRQKYYIESISQGSIVSPIFCNFFLHELDEYVVNDLSPSYNKGKARKKNSDYSKRLTLDNQEKKFLKRYPQLKKALERAKHNKFVCGQKFKAMDGFDPSFRRMHYVRYADDFLIGFTGPRKEALDIYNSVVTKLSELKLNVNKKKSKIYHSNDRGIKYLGVYLGYFKKNIVRWRKDGSDADSITKQIHHLQSQSLNTVHFRAPIDQMLKRLVDKGLAKTRKDNTFRGTAYIKYSMLEDEKIVSRFSAIIRGILNYYSCINRQSDLWKIFAILRKACALTLGHKHKIPSAARVYAKFGRNLTIYKLGRKITTLFYPESLTTKIDFKTRNGSLQYPTIIDIEIDVIKGSHKLNIKNADVRQYNGCEITENLEAHHTNPIANLSKRKDLSRFEKALI